MMKHQEQQVQNRQPKQIAPQQVWLSLTAKQQAQFIETMEAICQRLVSRQMREKEAHDATR